MTAISTTVTVGNHCISPPADFSDNNEEEAANSFYGADHPLEDCFTPVVTLPEATCLSHGLLKRRNQKVKEAMILSPGLLQSIAGAHVGRRGFARYSIDFSAGVVKG